MSLTYAKDAVIKGFVGVPDQLAIFGQNNSFADVSTATPQQQIDKIFAMSNCCKDGTTIFADDKATLPVSQPAQVLVASASVVSVPESTASAQAPAPPMKKSDSHLMDALLVGVGVFILYKILD